jgi:hypothetical protein
MTTQPPAPPSPASGLASDMRTAPLVLCSMIAASGCGEPLPKIAVAEPGENGTLSIALAPGEGMETHSVIIPAAVITMTTCIYQAGASLYLGDETNLDIVEIPLLAGRWCTLGIIGSGTVQIDAVPDEGGTFGATLGLERISIESAEGFDVDGHAYVLEVGTPGWLNATDLALTAGEEVTIDDTHPMAASLASALAEGSTLFPDFDGDGTVSDREREYPAASGAIELGDSGTPVDSGSPVDTGR